MNIFLFNILNLNIIYKMAKLNDDLIFLEPLQENKLTNNQSDEPFPEDTPDQIQEINRDNNIIQQNHLDDQPLSDLEVDVKDLMEKDTVEIKILPNMNSEYAKIRVAANTSMPSVVERLRDITKKIMKLYPELGLVMSMKLAGKYMEKKASSFPQNSPNYEINIKGSKLLKSYVDKMIKINPVLDKKTITQNVAKYLFYF